MERMRKNQRRGAKGFTLVELIVVIAVLAILAGVGTVAYSGYVKAAKKGVDKQTVGELIYAIQLADYADPGLFPDGSKGKITLSTGGAGQVQGSSDVAAFEAALNDSVGDISALRLSYDGWMPAEDLIRQFNEIKSAFTAAGLYNPANGQIAEIGYADVADEYWAYMEDVVTGALGRTDISEENFETLMVLTSYVVADQSTASDMGVAWANSANSDQTDLSTILGQLTQTQYTNTTAATARMFASEGGAYARNMAFARYLEKNGSYAGVEEDIAALKDLNNKNNLTTLSDKEGYTAALNIYLTKPVYGEHSQAYVDGVAFYTFMDSLNNQYGGDNIEWPAEANTSVVPTIANMPDDFWTDGASYVKNAADWVTDDSINFENDNILGEASGSVVIIYVEKTGGELVITVNPSTADPRDKTSDGEAEKPCEEGHTARVTPGNGRTGISFVDGDNIVLSAIEICSINSENSSCTLVIPDGTTVTAESSDDTIFKVEQDGQNFVIKAVGKGTATLTVTANSTTGSITVNVHGR